MSKSYLFYLSCKSLWLMKLKEFASLKLHKTYGEIIIKKNLATYLTNIGDLTFAKLVSLLIIFSGRDDIVTNLNEFDMAEMINIGRATIQRLIRKYKNSAFNVLASEHQMTIPRFLAGKDEYIACNSYELIENAFTDFDLEKFCTGSSLVIKFNYNNLLLKNYFINIYINKKTESPPITSTTTPYNMHHKVNKFIDNQPHAHLLFKHFNNPIYDEGFDVKGTLYPVNWYKCKQAAFIKGRWYGAIHNLKKKDRKTYLKSLGLTHEIDMHNAMFYFMTAILPDTISKVEKTAYLETVKSGRLYDEVVDMFTTHGGGLLPEDFVYAPDRSDIKERFQQYRNRVGKKKKAIGDVDYYFEQKFPAIRNWLLTQKQMQNKLAWIETDFMSLVCEKLSDVNIDLVWLHDAVYVSEDNSAKAQEIWNSVRDEFEAALSE